MRQRRVKTHITDQIIHYQILCTDLLYLLNFIWFEALKQLMHYLTSMQSENMLHESTVPETSWVQKWTEAH